MHRRGQSDAADARQHRAFHAQLVRLQMPGHPLRACQTPQRQQGAHQLAEHRGCRRTGHAPAQHRHEHKVQCNVDQRRKDEKIHRPFGIPHRPQNVGAHVVQHLGRHAKEKHPQIQRCIVQNFRRGVHGQQHRPGRQQAEHRQRRAARRRQHQPGVYLPVHHVPVACAVALRDDDPRAAAQPRKKAHQQLHERAGGAHRSQRPGAHKIAHDEGVHRVVQLLEQRAKPDGQKKLHQLFGNIACQNGIVHVHPLFISSYSML